jgi:hypothetical protein
MLFNSLTLAAVVTSAILASASPVEHRTRAAPLAQVITKCTVPNTAALTFDDGPYEYIQVCATFYDHSHLVRSDLSTAGIQNISKALTDVGGKGTFFWNGNNCELQ